MSEFWQDEDPTEIFKVSDAVQDLVFRISCCAVPVDHAAALRAALLSELPWLSDEPLAGIHLIHGAESGNGWQRPEADDGQLLHLSRRARMSLRLPRHRLADAMALTGRTLVLAGHELTVGEAAARPLSDITTLFARYVHMPAQAVEEHDFLHWARDALRALDIGARKMLAGRTRALRGADGDLLTRSLMLAGLEADEAVRLQQQGLGGSRLYGCGLFLPHKSIEPVAGARKPGDGG